ncbi:MAG: RNA polymerase sigma-70 factor [Mediterranea sp.]|jgi:RNA polymerase sigma-70 factor (ECF subfamily)|nr:RNA polymerase sigma-70 factor [Mediterranea sp.]
MNNNFEVTYKALFRKYYPGLLFYATRLIGDEEAEDVVQDVFVELWKRKDNMIIGDQIQSYLYKAAYTRALNVLKHRDIKDKHAAVEEEINRKRIEYYYPHEQNETIKRIEDRELRARIKEAIDELPEKCRIVFKLSYFHDMKNKDIAETMSISLRTVEAHMYKALKTLRARLEHLSWLFLLCFLFPQ